MVTIPLGTWKSVKKIICKTYLIYILIHMSQNIILNWVTWKCYYVKFYFLNNSQYTFFSKGRVMLLYTNNNYLPHLTIFFSLISKALFVYLLLSFKLDLFEFLYPSVFMYGIVFLFTSCIYTFFHVADGLLNQKSVS